MCPRITIYCNDDEWHNWIRFKNLFKAKNETASAKIKDFIQREVVANDPNWQKRLTHYTNEALNLCSCGAVAEYRVRYVNVARLVCEDCLATIKRERKYKQMGVRRLKNEAHKNKQ